MRAAIISQGSISSKWTFEEMKKYFDEVDFLNISKVEIKLGEKDGIIFHEGKPIKEYDCIYIKGSFRYASIQRSICTLLENKCYTPIKSSAFTVAHNKLLSQLKFQLANIKMPETYQTASVKAAKNLLKNINYPVIMKFLEGTQGKGVMYADSFASASSILDAIASLKQPFIIQEYIETGSTDIRAIVVGDEVVASMQRKGVLGEKRANIHAGGEGIAYNVDEKTKKLAVASAKAIGADICAVDILEGPKGPLVIEINISPGLQGVTKATGINVAGKIAKFLFEKAKKNKESTGKNGTRQIMDGLKGGRFENVLSSISLRGNRILLPEIATKLTHFGEGDEVLITGDKDKVVISKSK